MKNQDYSEFPHVSHEHMRTLWMCYSICSSCARMCMEEGHADTAVLCSECADICALTIKWHNADSDFTKKISEVCAQVCTKCAEACKHRKNSHCEQCSKICQECATACKEH